MLDKSVYLKRRIALLFLLFLLIMAGFLGVRSAVTKISNYFKYSKITVVKGKLKPGQVLFTSLLEQDVSREAANEVINSMQKILDLRSLRVNDEYKV